MSVDLVYGVANKADATARWTPPAIQTFAVSEYIYQWRFCSGNTCRRVADGTTAPGTTSTTADLSEGPGTYEFSVRASGILNGVTPIASIESTQRFTLLSSKAAPPSNVYLDVRGANGEVAWSQPSIRAGLVEGYEVEVRNVTKDGKWKTLPLTKKDVASFKASDIALTVGEIAQARVRTVLTNGQKSVFVASNQLTVSQQVPTPRVSVAYAADYTVDGAIIMRALPGDSVSREFPANAYQVRISSDGGTNWTIMEYAPMAAGIDPPAAANRTLVPYAENFVFAVPGRTDRIRLQLRGVDNSGRPPSDWIDFTAQPWPSLP